MRPCRGMCWMASKKTRPYIRYVSRTSNRKSRSICLFRPIERKNRSLSRTRGRPSFWPAGALFFSLRSIHFNCTLSLFLSFGIFSLIPARTAVERSFFRTSRSYGNTMETSAEHGTHSLVGVFSIKIQIVH